jgi:hypothetical protein
MGMSNFWGNTNPIVKNIGSNFINIDRMIINNLFYRHNNLLQVQAIL